MTVLPQLEQRLTDAIRAEHALARRAPRRRGRRLALTLGAMFVVSTTALAATQPWTSLDDAVNRGERPPAPDRTLPVVGASRTASLSQFRGRIVVLSFFASWCDPCRQQASLLDETGAALATEGKGVALLASWLDTAATTRDFVASHGFTMPVVADEHGLLAGDYGVDGLPTTFVIDADGRVVAISRRLATRQFLDDAIAKAEQPFHAP